MRRLERTITAGRARFRSRKESIKSRLLLRILISTEHFERRGSSVGIVTRPRVGRSGARDFLFSKTVQTGSGAQPTFYSMDAIILSRWQIDRGVGEVHHSPPSSAKG